VEKLQQGVYILPSKKSSDKFPGIGRSCWSSSFALILPTIVWWEIKTQALDRKDRRIW